MSDLRIAELPATRADALVRMAATVFHGSVEPDDVPSTRRALRGGVAHGAWDGDELAGVTATLGLGLVVPGGAPVPCAGLTAVGVLPTHRRRGVLRQLMARTLGDARAAGRPVAALWASEAAIYGRFGFGEAARGIDLRVDAGRPLALRVDPGHGPLRLRTPEEALREVFALHEEVRVLRPGAFVRDDVWWRDAVLSGGSWRDAGEPAQRTDAHVVLLGEPGAAEGYAVYRVTGRTWGRHGRSATVEVRELLARTAAGEAALWRYLADLDLAQEVVALNRPADDPLLLLAADRDQVQVAGEHEAFYLALLDVPEALTARAWAADVDVVLDLGDQRLRLTVRDGAAACRAAADAPADLALTSRDLASAYLGGTSVARLARAGLVEERTHGAAAALDLALRTERLPHTPDHF